MGKRGWPLPVQFTNTGLHCTAQCQALSNQCSAFKQYLPKAVHTSTIYPKQCIQALSTQCSAFKQELSKAVHTSTIYPKQCTACFGQCFAANLVSVQLQSLVEWVQQAAGKQHRRHYCLHALIIFCLI